LESSQHFQNIELPLSQFEYYRRGVVDPSYRKIDLSNVVSIGLQVFGGVYEEEKHSGASALEVDWIKVL